MGFSNQGDFDQKQDRSLDAETDVPTDGTGGGVMAIWKQDRVTKLRNLAAAAFSNNSSFSIPAGFVDTQDFQAGLEGGEKHLGVNATGTALDSDGTPLSGTASIELNGEVVQEAESVGVFMISIRPPAGVSYGTDTPLDAYDFRFTPDGAGLDYFDGNIGTFLDAGVFEYGGIEGTVTGYDGEPVDGATIFGEGEGTRTDADGYYKLVAPGGTEVTLYGVGHNKSKTPEPGQTITVDWQYSRLVVEVVTPDLEPISGTPVQIGQENYTTDEEGRVVIENALVTTYEVLVSETYYDETTIKQEGDRNVLRFGSERSGVDIRVVDEQTGEPIRDLPGIIAGTVNRSKSNRSGRLRIFTDALDDGELIVGAGDPRYGTEGFDVTVQDGETIEGRLEMEPKQQVSNT